MYAKQNTEYTIENIKYANQNTKNAKKHHVHQIKRQVC